MTHSAEAAVYAYMQKPSMVDYPGHLAAVFFTSGCNFSCGFCHNAALMGKPLPGLSWEQVEQACRAFKSEWVDAVVVTGGEPTMHAGLPEVLELFRGHGLAVKLDTNGSNPAMLEKVLPLCDYVAMDIKTDPEHYGELAGYDRMDNIRRSIALIREQAKDYEFRTTVIVSHHSDEVMRRAADLIRPAKRYILQAFVPKDDLPDPALSRVERTFKERLNEIRLQIAECAEEVIVRGE